MVIVSTDYSDRKIVSRYYVIRFIYTILPYCLFVILTKMNYTFKNKQL